ncbi:hypothetical protein [Acidiphilium multivorum]|uniref:hypothetical protein n=1 Tax=Acidiphilium multivorum TaxID=62140 RepID=UPI001B8C08D1|nr:hypothetical protein [Acidiphilium multivorum]MBS3025436.1 hypothetical protein [Acidiphilium multivorum]
MIARDQVMQRGFEAEQQLGVANSRIQELNNAYIEEAAKGWLWSSRALSLEDIIHELQDRYPNDPLFRKVGGLTPNGKPKMVLHQKIDFGFRRYLKATGLVGQRAQSLLKTFLSKRTL